MTAIFTDVMLWIGTYVFYYPVVMSLTWVIGGLFFYFRQEKGKADFPKLRYAPMVSVLIPARNEAGQLEETVKAVVESEYPNLEIIIINDASIDGTAEIADSLSRQHEMVRVLHLKQNMGKANGMNNAFLMSTGEVIVTIDADCIIDKPAIYWIAWHFINFPRAGAVTGNPHVRNRTSLLAQLQTAEYTSVIGLIKRAQRILGKLLTISGVIGAFRREALVDVGFWSFDMVTEDIDITWKLEKRFWDIRYEANAVGWILVPETLSGLWGQRLRWAQGSIEAIRRHRDVWTDWRQRRIWPVYIDYLLSIFWSCSFLLIAVYWLWAFFTGRNDGVFASWNGCMVALACLIQFAASICIDMRYDHKILPTYFWVIWYPVFYWMFNAFATICALPKGLSKKFGQTSLWVSPDRGILQRKRVFSGKHRNKLINDQEKLPEVRKKTEWTIKLFFSFILTLFTIMTTISLWSLTGIYLYEHLFSRQYFEQTVEVILFMLMLSATVFVAMYLWQQYNLRVFGFRGRRKFPQPVSDEKLASIYSTTVDVLQNLRLAQKVHMEYGAPDNGGAGLYIVMDEKGRSMNFGPPVVKE